MLFLADFSPIKPDFGLLFWTLLIFLLVWIPIGRKVIKPILQALKDREQGIADALASADNAKKEMANLKADNESLLAQAKEERMTMLKEAKDEAARVIAESKNQAKEEANRILANTKTEIENMKQQMLTDVKNQAGNMAIEIAEKIIRKELKGNSEQEAFANQLAKEMNLN
jgi:F-type H+-transporting ATPase subunit b